MKQKPKELDWEKEVKEIVVEFVSKICSKDEETGENTSYSERVISDLVYHLKLHQSQTLTQQRTELLEEIKNMINSCYWIGGTNFVVNGKQEKMISKAEITEKFTNLLNKKNETK